MSETTILNYTWPIFTIVFTKLIFDRKGNYTPINKIVEIVGVMIGFLSIVILATKGDFSTLKINGLGIMWGLTGGVSYGLYSAYSSTVENTRQSTFLLISILISIILLVIPSINESALIINNLTMFDIVITFALGAILEGLGYITWTSANRLSKELRVDISSVASLMFVLPIVSLVIVRFFLSEEALIQPYFIASLILIITSSVICQRTKYLSNIITGIVQRRTLNRQG